MVAAGPFWSLHTHSKYSVNDALPEVQACVDAAVKFDYPALGLTDHGSPSGNIQLYTACRKAGIEPIPGVELYVVPEMATATRKGSMHLTMGAYSEAGYRNLVHVTSTTAKRFWYKPLLDFADFAAMAEDGATKGLAIGTGCYGGVIPTVLRTQGEAAAAKALKTLAGWFPKVYVELQNHGIEDFGDGLGWTDDDMVDALWNLANDVGLPVIITRDSHYVNPADRYLHDGLKQTVTFLEDVDDAVFNGHGYHMTNADGLKEFFSPKVLEAGLAGLTELANAAYVRLPEMENFTLKIPDVTTGTEDPQQILEEKVMRALTPAERKNQVVLDLLRDEFDVIRLGNMAPYLLLVDMVCEFMRERSIRYAARGSAAGSYVNYKLRITQPDPLRFGLRFDRFLSRNRMKPPDVDLDVEHSRRHEVIAFIESKWAVRPVGNLRKYSLFEAEEGDDSGGSLRVRYYSARAKRGLPRVEWRDLPKEETEVLYKLGDMKLIAGYGKHAAGYIVAPNREVLDQLPLAYIASSGSLVTAYGKKDVEKLGFLKLDLLGLRTMTAIDVALKHCDVVWDQIPDDDKATFAMIGRGDVAGVFQLDGYAMRKGCEQIRPKRLEDIIAAQALFRPATMNSGATGEWRDRRAGREPVPTRHDDIMKATKETFGVLLYQEQVMDVMQSLGLDQLEQEEMLDAVKASNEYSAGAAVAIEQMLPRIRELARGRGWTEVDIEWLADGLGAYADYSFNKAHAASYGIVAYRTAYLKCHHPVAFWLGMLVAYADASKPTGKPHPTVTYSAAARRDGVRILPPRINRSGVLFTMDDHRGTPAIRKGLLTVKGCGQVAAAELVDKAPFTSLKDLGERVIAKKVTGAKHLALGKPPVEAGGVIAALADADALEGLE